MRAPRFFGAVVCTVMLAIPGLASGQEAFSNELFSDAPKRTVSVTLRATPDAGATRIDLPAPDAAEIQAIREANAARKQLQIGLGRTVEGVGGETARSLAWRAVEGGHVAHWRVTSAGARALRLGFDAAALAPGAELRFVGLDAPGMTYPVPAREMRSVLPTYWSPVLEGETALVEIFVPDAVAPAGLSLALVSVSHLFVSPSDADAESAAKAAGACQVDLVCRSASDASLAFAARSVARMAFNVGSTPFLCTGTLMTTSAGVGHPYFLTSNICIGSQSSASTLTTHWFYERTGCGVGGTSSSYVQLTGGATLLYANSTTDVSLLRLNTAPPPGVVYAGWVTTTLANGTALTGIHHPHGDWKKVSLGTSGGFSAYGGGAGSTHLIVLWNSTATGVTEPGSAGSPVMSFSSTNGYQVRGALQGGPSSCSATGANLRDYYSRFDQAYPAIAPFLSPTFNNLVNNPGFESGAVGWAQQSSGGYPLIINEPANAFAGSYDAWLGGYDSGTDTLYQDIAIPGNADMVRFDHRYRIDTAETGSTPYDYLYVQLVSPSSGAVLANLGTYTNANAASGWQFSPSYDLTSFRGQTVRLRFRATTDFSNITNFRLDDIRLMAVYTTANDADVSITQSLAPNPAAVAKDAVVTLTAKNFGPGTAANVTVNYSIPGGTSYLWSSPGCTRAGGTVTCTAGSLVVGGSRAFKVVVRPGSITSMTGSASITTSSSDPFTANNAISLTALVNSTAAGTPVFRYRLYSPVTLEHHFTTDLNEYIVLGTHTGTWVQEGTVGKVLNNPGSFAGVGAVPYYRLYDTNTRWHHWTTDANEYYTLAEFPWWTAEGVDGYLLPTNPPGTTQLFRLLYPHVAGLHHWTIDPHEYNVLINQYGWIGEGGSGFVVYP